MPENVKRERTKISPMAALYGQEMIEKARKAMADRFDPTAPLPPTPDWKFFVHDEYDNDTAYGMALRGSIIELYGMSKTRKSTLLAIFAAAILSKEKRAMNISTNITGPVIWIDTEQGEDEFAYFQRMVFQLANRSMAKQTNKYYAMNFRPHSEEDRVAMFDIMMHGMTEVGCIFIDGIADFSPNSNEMEANKRLITQVTQWADMHQCPLFTAIHANKDGKTSTGTLGGYLDKKASSVIVTEVNSEDGPTTVVNKLTRRGLRFPSFQFMHNRHELPELVDPMGIIGDGDFKTGGDD